MNDFSVGAGDYQRALFYKLGPVVSLTGQTVKFSLYNHTERALQINARPAQAAVGTYVVDGTSYTFALSDGVLLYVPTAPDFDVAGVCAGWFTLTDGSSRSLTVPGDTALIRVDIVPRPPSALSF